MLLASYFHKCLILNTVSEKNVLLEVKKVYQGKKYARWQHKFLYHPLVAALLTGVQHCVSKAAGQVVVPGTLHE